MGADERGVCVQGFKTGKYTYEWCICNVFGANACQCNSWRAKIATIIHYASPTMGFTQYSIKPL